MKRKYLLRAFFSLLVCSASVFSFAQGLGIDYLGTGELATAKSVFEKELASNPGEANYYLGEIAYLNGDLNLAKSYYEKGLAAAPDYVLNNVGLGKLLLKTDVKAAENEFSTALKKDKKDVAVLVAIARAYADNGMGDKSDKSLADARKANKKSPLIYVLEGDILKEKGDVGGAAGQYEQAIFFDPDYTIPYIKIAQIYGSINPSAAIDKLNKVLELRPDYTLANKYLGNIYYQNGQYNRAIEAFKTYFSKGEYSVEDLTRYAAALYFTERYDDASKLIQEGIAKDPNNFVLNRLLMYSALETKDYGRGLEIAGKFFNRNETENEYIARDYMTYGKLLSENKQSEEALAQYEKAIELDPEQYAVYKEIAETLASSGNAAMGAEYYKKYINAADENAEALDFFNMGRYYYMAANTLGKDTLNPEAPALAKEYLQEADAAFGVVGERIPDSHLGFVFRARTNSLLDPETSQGLAKPYYEKTVEVITAKEDPSGNNRELLEAYRYLSYYYYLQYEDSKSQDDKQNAIMYSEKMLELDPTNSVANQLLEALK